MSEASSPAGMLRVDRIRTFDGQPRADMDADRIRELADSMRAHGMLVPVVVRPVGRDAYELIDGERRLRAARLLELEYILAVIRPVGDGDEQFALAVVANAAREELNPMERARAMRRLCAMPDMRLLKPHAQCHRIAAMFGRSYSWAYTHMRLIDAAPEVQADVESGALTPMHATALAGAPRKRQAKLAEVVKERSLTGIETAQLVEASTGRTTSLARISVRLSREEARALLGAWKFLLGRTDASVVTRNLALREAMSRVKTALGEG